MGQLRPIEKNHRRRPNKQLCGSLYYFENHIALDPSLLEFRCRTPYNICVVGRTVKTWFFIIFAGLLVCSFNACEPTKIGSGFGTEVGKMVSSGGNGESYDGKPEIYVSRDASIDCDGTLVKAQTLIHETTTDTWTKKTTSVQDGKCVEASVDISGKAIGFSVSQVATHADALFDRVIDPSLEELLDNSNLRAVCKLLQVTDPPMPGLAIDFRPMYGTFGPPHLRARFDTGLKHNGYELWSVGPFLKQIATAIGFDFLNMTWADPGWGAVPGLNRYRFALNVDKRRLVNPDVPYVYEALLNYNVRITRTEIYDYPNVPAICYLPGGGDI